LAPRTALMCVRAVLAARAATSGERDECAAAGGLRAILALHDHGEAIGGTRLSQLRYHAHLLSHALRGSKPGAPPTQAHTPSTPSTPRTPRTLATCAPPTPDATTERCGDEATLSLLLRLALTNSFCVSETVVGETAVGETVARGGAAPTVALGRAAVGEALYGRAALLNHACAPNANVRYAGITLEVRAARQLATHEEVSLCYGPQAGYAPRHERRAALARVYHFDCACAACAREAEAAAGSAAGAAGAPAARRKEGGAPPAAVDAVELRARAQALDERARVACERGEHARAAECSARALALLRRVFDAGSPQLAMEEAKLARLLFNAQADARAYRALEAAAAAMAALAETDEACDLRRLASMCAR
jgi:hypothetical protein